MAAITEEAVSGIAAVSPISDDEKNAMKRLTAHALPDSPAEHGLRADAVKPAFWRGFVGDTYSVVSFFNRLVTELNVDFNTIKSLFVKFYNDLDGQILSAKDDALAAAAEAAQEKLAEHNADADLEGVHKDLLAAFLESIAGATEEARGFMTPAQVKSLNTLVALLESEDADTTINTIAEVLKAFENAPEGTDVANALAAKLEKLAEDLKNVVYVNNADGVPGHKPLSVDATADSIPLRNEKGTFFVSEAEEEYNPVVKKQFDKGLAGKLAQKSDGRAAVTDGTAPEDAVNLGQLNAVRNHVLSGISRNSKEIESLKQRIDPALFQTDASTAYVKDVPDAALPYAEVTGIGGMTHRLGGENLITAPFTELTEAIVTDSYSITPKADGTIELLGDVFCAGEVSITKIRLDNGRYKIACSVSNSDDGDVHVYLFSEKRGWIVDCWPTEDAVFYINEEDGYEDVTLFIFDGWWSYEAVQTLNIYLENLQHNLLDAKVTEIKSVGVNLIPYPYENKNTTVNGVTFTDNGDGTITANGTATEQAFYNVFMGYIGAGKYFLSGAPIEGGDTTQIYLSNNDYSLYYADLGMGIPIDIQKEEFIKIAIIVLPGATVSNLVFKPMLNVGEVAYPYMPYAEHHLHIPAYVQALDGWGRGRDDTCHNYIDWRPQDGVKRFVKNTKRIVLDGVSEKVEAVFYDSAKHIYYATYAGKNLKGWAKLVSNTFNSSASHIIGNAYVNGINRIVMLNTDQTLRTVAAWNEWLTKNPVEFECELSEPEIIDLSDVLTDDNLIEVEPGGMIMAVNEHGLAVPTEIEFQLEDLS